MAAVVLVSSLAACAGSGLTAAEEQACGVIATFVSGDPGGLERAYADAASLDPAGIDDERIRTGAEQARVAGLLAMTQTGNEALLTFAEGTDLLGDACAGDEQ